VVTTSTAKAPPIFICPGIGKYPDPVDCSKFHLCINAVFEIIDVVMSCPEGTLYDAFNQRCTINPVQCPGEEQIVCDRPGLFPHPTDCNRYYKCIWKYIHNHFELRQYRCPPKFEFSAVMKFCIPSRTCQSHNDSFECSEPGRFPVETNCKEYYECKEINGILTKELKSCNLFKLFDRELRRCRNECLVNNCPFD
jgi:hypothetical protein